MLAIPAESADPGMSIFKFEIEGAGPVMEGSLPSNSAWTCGHCGRVLISGMGQDQLQDIWISCPRCEWLNASPSLSLSWAMYAIRELQHLALAEQRVTALLAAAKTAQAEGQDPQSFVEGTPDLAPARAWLARLNWGVVIALLTLFASVVSNERAQSTANQSLDVSRQALEQQRRTARSDGLSEADVGRVARGLVEAVLQADRSTAPKSSGRHKKRGGGKGRRSRR